MTAGWDWWGVIWVVGMVWVGWVTIREDRARRGR